MRPRRRTSSATKLSLDARLSLCFPAWAALVPLARSQFIPRNFSGIGNNVANPTWGAAETTQVRIHMHDACLQVQQLVSVCVYVVLRILQLLSPEPGRLSQCVTL